ncbi:MAG: cell division protein FtsZ [Micavibrio aeruginosavorus]|uniref:Cell division protein FtsZ n=1 Tax=Micavibrio aeruginosavorus TaxID=349221 RepID=A0A2W5PXC1_9BACT|nr:MAG: cell division protein FtsZ [Micavibrio aeruginosavorus]
MAINFLKIQAPEVQRLSPKIHVFGVGGAGGNAVNNMISSGLEGVEFIVANTDAQALEGSLCENRLQLGTHVTGGLGAGAKPEMGMKAAEESIEEVMDYLQGSNMVFITAGMGGGTGTGAAPVIARACREAGILTVGVVTKPFRFEGAHRMRQAEAGIAEMQQYVDTLIVIPNQNLFRIANEKTTFADAFRMADSVLQSGVRGVTDLITKEGLINLDFSDIRSAMLEMGKAMMGTGEAEGERRALEAAEAAINNPLLDDVSMKGARGLIINVTGGADMTLFEVDEACNRVVEEVDPNANIIVGSTFDDKMEGRIRVSVVATGIDADKMQQPATTSGGLKITAVGKPQPETKPQSQVFERARPQANAIQTSTAQARAAIPTRAAQPFPAMQAKAFDEPERDMFEQQEFAPAAEQAPMQQAQPPMPAYVQATLPQPAPIQQPQAPMSTQATGLRGTLHDGHFIPPKPIVPEPQEPAAYGMGGYAAQQQGQGYNLRPPVPGANAQQQQQERKKTPSLFERITSGVRNAHAQVRHAEESASEEVFTGYGAALPPAGVQQQATGTGGFHSSLRATPRAMENPAQGQLNIDAPAAKRATAEEELDIPAFLRRQAN